MRVTERIAAARDLEAGPDKWAFSETELSGFFKFCLTDVWALRIQADYYSEFWADILKALKDEKGPVEIRANVLYHIGKEDESTIKQYMQRWVGLKTGFLAVREADEPDGVPQFVHMTLEGFEIKPLEVAV
jgi:hypothetical protein